MKADNLHDAYLALGSNLGDTDKNLKQALDYIEKRIGRLITCSAFYTTDPVGFDSVNKFKNAACQVQTTLTPLKLLQETQNIEIAMGRLNKSRNGMHTDRIIDLDILLYDNLIMDTSNLKLPHPHLHERDFVLIPLAEIAGELKHPIFHKTVKELATLL